MDSICPILSIGSSQLKPCLGADCKWWPRCNYNVTLDIQEALREAERFAPGQKGESE